MGISAEQFASIVVSDAKSSLTKLRKNFTWLRQVQKFSPITKEDMDSIRMDLDEIESIYQTLNLID